MENKAAFLHTIGEELDQLLKQVELEYREKLKQLLVKNNEITTSLNKANEEIQHLTKKNEELMKELASFRQPINEVEVVTSVPKKENTLTTHIYQQIYKDLASDRVKKEDIVEDFYNLLKWNIKSKYYEDSKIIALWIRLLSQYHFIYSDWHEKIKDENIHALLFKRTHTDVRKLIDTYIKLNDIEAIKNIFDYLLTQIVKKGRFDALKNSILLYILYYGLAKRYLYQKDVRVYYLNTNNMRLKFIYEDYLLYLSSPSQKTYLRSLGSLEKYDTEIIKIGGSKSAYLNTVFKEAREVEKAEQKVIMQLNDVQKTENRNAIEGQLYEMNDKSALIAYGYQISDRTPDQRWRALQKAVPELGLKKVVYIIDNHIKLRAPNKAKFSYSLRQWTMDLEKLKKTYFQGDFIWPKNRY